MRKYRLTAWILICILTLSGCGMVGDTKSEHEPRIFGATYMTRNNPYFDVIHEAIEEVVEANGDILISPDHPLSLRLSEIVDKNKWTKVE